MKRMSVNVIPSFPLIASGDNVGRVMLESTLASGLQIDEGDVFV
mgnify:CR=1